MPICERDPWRFQFFEGVNCPDDVRVPTDDIDSFEWFPQHAWVYQKQRIARSQGLPCGDLRHVPSQFPVFAKPDVNLRGMGLGSCVITDAAQFRALMQPDMMWMPLFQGEHISSDAAIENGRCVWLRHSHGVPWTAGMFKHWTVEAGGRAELDRYLTVWIANNMAGYTGMMNFESIGGQIIEAHLRFADQWCDLYGAGWLQALIGLYQHGQWTLQKSETRVGFSVPLFTTHGLVPEHPGAEAQAVIRAMKDVSSLQITFYPAKPGEAHPMPPGGFRLGIINCWNLESGFEARRALARCFPDCQIMLPE